MVSPAVAAASAMVQTSQGTVVGLSGAGVNMFLGIPFAAPPVGQLRFRPPQPPAPWTSALDASHYSKRSIQGPPVSKDSISEDCLYLNVFTPQKRSAHSLPVMVWIHGGGFIMGAGDLYDGSIIAAKGNVIVVTFNYRLGALGFLSLPELDAESENGTSGNYGFLDQQAALRWVQKNIGAFGGDPDNVTIFGESAGGHAVCAHLLAPGSKGLFQRAISQSGFSGRDIRNKTTAFSEGNKFVSKLGCTAGESCLKCLREKTAEAILSASPSFGAFGLVGDNQILPQAWIKSMGSGHFEHVPIIMGGTRDEGSIFVKKSGAKNGAPMSSQQYKTEISQRFGDKAEQVLKQYPIDACRTPYQVMAAVFTDGVFSSAIQRATRLMSRYTPVYAYEFDYVGSVSRSPYRSTPDLDYGVAHSSDNSYTFGQGLLGDQPGPPLTADEIRVSDQMIGYWTRFAATGDPCGKAVDSNSKADRRDKAPTWSQYDLTKDNVLLIDKTTTMGTIGARHKYDFWESSGLLDRPMEP